MASDSAVCRGGYVAGSACGRCRKCEHELLGLISDLAHDSECRYDHHGYCQEHDLHEKPCPHETARKVLKGRQVDPEFALVQVTVRLPDGTLLNGRGEVMGATGSGLIRQRRLEVVCSGESEMKILFSRSWPDLLPGPPPGWRRLRVGDGEVTELEDGTARLSVVVVEEKLNGPEDVRIVKR